MAKQVSNSVLISAIIVSLILGAGGMYLLTNAFPATFVTFRATELPTTQLAIQPTTNTDPQESRTQNQNLITNQPITEVDLGRMTFTNSTSGGLLVLDNVSAAILAGELCY